MSLWGYLTDSATRAAYRFVMSGGPFTTPREGSGSSSGEGPPQAGGPSPAGGPSQAERPRRTTIYVRPLPYLVDYCLDQARKMVLETAGIPDIGWNDVCGLIHALGEHISPESTPDAIAIEVTYGDAINLVQALKAAFDELIARNNAMRRRQAAVINAAARDANGGIFDYVDNSAEHDTRHIANSVALCAGTVVIAGMTVAPVMSSAIITAAVATNAATIASPEAAARFVVGIQNIYEDAYDAIFDPESNFAIAGAAAFFATTVSVFTAMQMPYIFAAVATVAAARTASSRVRNRLTTRRFSTARQRGGGPIQDSRSERRRNPPEDREDAPKRQRRQ
jgi:hypothetical protein